MTMLRRSVTALIAAFAGLVALEAKAADAPIVIGLPGIPPVFLSVQQYVAQDEGFFKKHGVDVQLRPFDTGAAAGRAVASGDIDTAMVPSPVVINMVANGNVPLIGIYGLEHPDWLIGSTDPAIKDCKDIVGQPIGVDTPGGARSVALRQMIVPPPCSLKMEQMQQVALGSNTSAAMIAGQIKLGVLHLDDVPVVEHKLGRPLTTVITLKQVKPVSHYDLMVVRKDKLAANRDKLVRVVAALNEAEAFMRDPKNWDRVAKSAAPTGRTPAEAKDSLKKYLDIEFWPKNHDGLTEKNLEVEIKTQVTVGGIQPGKPVPTPESLIDRSLFRDAANLGKK
jgi:NitT/TauT family transport system substrate-binding protein